MKKLILIFTAAAFMGCGKQNTVIPITKAALLVGQWYYTVDTVKTYANGTLSLVSSKSYSANHQGSDYVKFNTGGTGVQFSSASGNTLAFNYTVSGESVLLNYPAQTVLGTSTAALSQTATIDQLTNSNLELFFDNSTTANGVTTRVTEAAYFSK